MSDATTAEVVRLECGCEQLAHPEMHVRYADFEFGRGEQVMCELFGDDWRDDPTLRVLGFVRRDGRVTVERFRIPYVIHGQGGDDAHAATYVEMLE